MTNTTPATQEFVGFGKIPRLSRNCVVTEKIDGTNALVFITEDGDMMIGSRNRWITPADDNYGFARWCEGNREELLKLGPGRHWGEWWGAGIQRGYGLKGGDKRFSLFNTARFCLHGTEPQVITSFDPNIAPKIQIVLPPCVGLVPVLWSGEFNTEAVYTEIERLKALGSAAVPGYMDPEGIIVYHVAGNLYFKKTIKKDEEPKGNK